jgi:hypothetical protein
MALLDPCMGFHPVDGWRNQIFIVGLLIKGFLPHVRKLKLIPQSTNKTPTPPTGSTETSLISCIAKSEDLTDDISTPAGVILFLWSPFTHQPRCNQCGKEKLYYTSDSAPKHNPCLTTIRCGCVWANETRMAEAFDRSQKGN